MSSQWHYSFLEFQDDVASVKEARKKFGLVPSFAEQVKNHFESKHGVSDYKFKDWTTHQTTPEKLNQPVTIEEKRERAEKIATDLSDNKLWHSHGRMIGVSTLQKVLRLKIEDYSKDAVLRPLILAYSDFLTDYLNKNGHESFLHSKYHF